MDEKEVVDLLETEFYRGAQAMLSFIQKKGTECNGKDDCVICQTGNGFFRRQKSGKVL